MTDKDKEEYDKLLSCVFEQIEKIKDTMFTPEERLLLEDEVHDRVEYEAMRTQYAKYDAYDQIINDVGYEAANHQFYHKAYCSVCGKDEIMLYSGRPIEDVRDKVSVHFFREGFFCPECGCNARLRYMVHKIRQEYKRGMKVYLYERITPTYRAISKFIPEDDLTGSEYFGSEHTSGEYVDGILHEDAAHLSFADNSFDLMLSMDVFEHTYYYKDVFAEVYRVLKPGGKLLLTIPMRPVYDETVERAKIVEGKIVHIMEPLMHGDPMSPEGGVLEFIMYGWDIIPIMKSFGFKDVKMKTYYSVNDAYLGELQYYFELTK